MDGSLSVPVRGLPANPAVLGQNRHLLSMRLLIPTECVAANFVALGAPILRDASRVPCSVHSRPSEAEPSFRLLVNKLTGAMNAGRAGCEGRRAVRQEPSCTEVRSSSVVSGIIHRAGYITIL